MRSLDDACSRHFTYRDLIECGKTWERLSAGGGFENVPIEIATWEGLATLARDLLDPTVDRFGRPTLTYCFASSALARRVPGRIAPRLDQHAGAERSRRGERVCPRGGQSVDFIVPGETSLTVAEWIIETREFDRLYYYGESLPLHVSVAGPDRPAARDVVMMLERAGRRVPRRVRPEELGRAIHMMSLDSGDPRA